MTDFLQHMAHTSRQRAEAAAQLEPLAALRARCADLPPTVPLVRVQQGLSLIAEIKLRSPAAGTLGDEDSVEALVARAQQYVDGGVSAISVLTEPERFGGALAHLSAVAKCAHAADVPVMRKDFITDLYQIFEARAAGADGVLLIKRMLDDVALAQMLAAAGELGLFVLLEAFDRDDLEQSRQYANEHVLIGLNCRDLTTLQIDPARFSELIGSFPANAIKVAESGIHSVAEAVAVAQTGYDMALIGTALMTAAKPTELLVQIRRQTAESPA